MANSFQIPAHLTTMLKLGIGSAGLTLILGCPSTSRGPAPGPSEAVPAVEPASPEPSEVAPIEGTPVEVAPATPSGQIENVPQQPGVLSAETPATPRAVGEEPGAIAEPATVAGEPAEICPQPVGAFDNCPACGGG